MVPLPELSRPAELCDEVSCFDTGRHLVRSGGLSRVGEGNPYLFGLQTGDRRPGGLVHGPLKEGRKEGVPQLILHRLKCPPYTQGDALQKC